MGSEARARLGLAALLAVTLLGFSRVFADGDYPGPALLGALLAGGITMLARRYGLVVWATFVASAIGLVWYLMLVFQSSATFYGLPTPSAASGLVAEAIRAYELSSVDYAPVPLRPGYMILTVAALWMLTTLGEVGTFRWRRPLLVVVAATAMFAFLLITGTPDGASFFAVMFIAGALTFLGLESAHRMQAWGQWVTAWSAKRWDTEVSFAPLARRMGVSVLACAIAAPLFLPSIGEGLLKWRNPTGPGLAGGRVDTLVELAPKLITQTRTILFRVEADEPEYWRLVTLSYFDGNAWHPGARRAALGNNRVATEVPAPVPGRILEQRFDIEALEGLQLPAAVTPETVAFEGSNAEAYDGSLQFNPITGDIETSTPLTESAVYRVQSLLPDVSYKDMKDAQVPTGEEFQLRPREYLDEDMYEVPSAFCPDPDVCENDPESGGEQLRRSRIYRIAQRWTENAETPFEKLIALQNRFRGNFRHQLPGPTEIRGDVEVKPAASADYLLRFLTRDRVGYCQQFATAFAVLARMLGYPARVAVGFLPGEPNPNDPTKLTVRGNDAHAWPEIYFDQIGWVRFEPTPRGDSPPPAYTQARLPGAGVNPPTVEETRGRAGQGLQDAAGRRRARLNRQRRLQRNDDTLIDEAWRSAFFRLALVLALIALAFLLAIPTLKAALNRRRYAKAKGAKELTHAAFAEFEQEAADLVGARRPAESPNSYVQRLVSLHRVPAPAAQRLAGLFEEAAYGPIAITDPQAAEAKRLVRKLRRDLWAQAGWVERAERLFSPAVVLAELRPPQVRDGNGTARPNGRPGRAGVLLREGSPRDRTPPAAER